MWLPVSHDKACAVPQRIGAKPSRRSQGCGPGKRNAVRATAQDPSHSETDWIHSMPSYLQSTAQTDICDSWSDAINEAEAEASAREKARQEGRDPDDAARIMRAQLRDQRTQLIWGQIRFASPPFVAADSVWAPAELECMAAHIFRDQQDMPRQEAAKDIEQEPMLSSFLYASILAHRTFHEALSFVLSNRLADQTMLPTQLFSLFESLFKSNPEIIRGAIADLQAVYDRDPACISYSCALLYFKGYQAIQIQRLAHALWLQGRRVMALSLQSRMSEVLGLDIHPAATFGKGILLDHGTGVVIGETAVIGNGVSIMQNVTLGGTGKEVGDRHPKIHNNVLIGAGAAVLGNIEVGTGAQVVAGSLVLKPVEAHTMVAGSPAKFVGYVRGNPALEMEQWSKLIFENGRVDLLKTGVTVKQGHASAEDAIFGTSAAGGAPGPSTSPSGAGEPSSKQTRAPESTSTAPPDATAVRSQAQLRTSSPEAASASAPSEQQQQLRAASGMLASISQAESKGQHARIEKKREWIRGDKRQRGVGAIALPATVSNGATPAISRAPQATSSNGAQPAFTSPAPAAHTNGAGAAASQPPPSVSKRRDEAPAPAPKKAAVPDPPPAPSVGPPQPAEEMLYYDI